MTTAAKGVQKALARAGSSVLAIAEMTAEDLIAQMTDDQKAGISAALAPAGAAASKAADHKEPDPMEPDGDPDDENCEDKAGAKKKPACDDDGANAADPRVKAVAAAVANDPACKGKADLALSMLADDDYARLSASGIVKLLGKTAPPSASAADPEAAARAEMKAALDETKNSSADANSGGGTDKAKASAGAWDRVYADLSPNKAN